jgi:hypothetical protein
VSDHEISKKIEAGCIFLKTPELISNSRLTKNVCDSVNLDIHNFIQSLMDEMGCDENGKLRVKTKDFNSELRVVYDMDIFNQDYISIRLTIYSYRGGTHGASFYKCFTYKMEGAKKLSLGDVLFLKRKKELESLNRLLDKYFVDPDHCFSRIPFVTSDFQFFSYQDDCLVFSFSESSLGAYVCGSAEVKIPIWDVKQHGLLKL